MSRGDLPLISIILTITEFEAKQYLTPFLNSIFNLLYPKSRLEVILRDNGLVKISRISIKKQFPRVKITGDGKNVNFAKGINEAAKKSLSSWLFITNADTILHPDCLKKLVEVGEKESNIAIAGPLVFSLENKNLISQRDLPILGTNFTLGTIKNLNSENFFRLKRITDVYSVSACGMLVKKEIWEKLGGFDERFYAYWEDADFGVRVKKSGGRVVVIPSAKIWHKGSAVFGVESPKKIYYLARNHLLFWDKHLNFLGKILFQFRSTLLVLVKITKFLFGVKRNECRAFVLGLVDFYLERFGERR